MRKVKPLREFEFGEIVHILDEEPADEQVMAAGCELLEWSDTTRQYAGRKAEILKRGGDYQQHGWIYTLAFDGDERDDFYGIDFQEFYEEQKSVLTPEALITLLG